MFITKVICIILTMFCFNVLSEELSLMSYNVQNLFDSVHNENVDDWEFTPTNTPGKKEYCQKEHSKYRVKKCLNTNWNEEKLKIKIEQISEVVKKANPLLPDFLSINEIENLNVLKMLSLKLGYNDFEITAGPDKRGVNVALLFKLNKDIVKVSTKELIIPNDYPTRNILEVRFRISTNSFLTIFVNHWPSLQNPDSYRIKAAEVLRKRIEEILIINSRENIIAMGDFNTIDSSSPHPFSSVLYRNNLLSDIYQLFAESRLVSERAKKNMGTGTYYYAPHGTWNLLDHFFVNHNLLDNKDLEAKIESFNIFSDQKIIEEHRQFINTDKERSMKVVFSPKKYNHESHSKESAGYSDHFPILLNLTYTAKK